ncbi:hypothetical protein KXW42_000885 [Aspergillus fumigatus]|nr:hypothetical protein KXX32_000659 [Aspergillus fumigatus]KAH1599906.1 hypothetical protein KXX34_006653 [Aspergillus fumigatus]KAH1647706.1 hypothetical protein KXX59_006800 [Aspergillus fumigatus]KAH1703676.1 hypothetical protein KXX23_007006 [Aspergillus fumigatus]KAH2656335.1 hypothetical protein KXV79_006988 [Aspergillus fumigatus]
MSFGGFGGFGQNTQQSSGFGAGSGFGSTTSGGGLCWCLLTSTRDGLSQPLDLATTPRTTRDEGRRSIYKRRNRSLTTVSDRIFPVI